MMSNSKVEVTERVKGVRQQEEYEAKETFTLTSLIAVCVYVLRRWRWLLSIQNHGREFYLVPHLNGGLKLCNVHAKILRVLGALKERKRVLHLRHYAPKLSAHTPNCYRSRRKFNRLNVQWNEITSRRRQVEHEEAAEEKVIKMESERGNLNLA